jgi:ADP-ribose pyrophosphatase YjhB (NUDIX family)
MAEEWPKIRSRQRSALSPWMDLVVREVEFAPGAIETYHAVEPKDYLAIVAMTTSGHFPIVRQYRPAIEDFTWELPAGLAEPGEDLAEGCRRELLEETGYLTRAIHPLGTGMPCTGRLGNRIHSFFIEAGERVADFVAEPGMTVRLVDGGELAAMIREGSFASQLHLGALLLAELRSLITLR